MILLDTNVLSELMKASPAEPVRAFIRAHEVDELFMCTVCEAEIRYGIARLPAGRRRADLEEAFQTFIDEGFAERVVPFDGSCARSFAAIRARRDAAGQPISFPDAAIAATAAVHGATLLTRHAADFAGCDIPVVNPWASSPEDTRTP